jgi:NAD(P)-dependent dehydrogenase (short-subunit alcohol dehydrogenase family)
MAYQILRQELADRDIAVGSVRPGVVDTPMQALIRAQTQEDFPAVERFRALKAMGELTSAEDAAAFIEAVVNLRDAQRFSEAEWDIREHTPVTA